MEKYYLTAEEVNNLASELFSAECAMKYLCAIDPGHEDYKFRTPELIQAFADLVGTCEDYINACGYYLKK